VSLKNILLGGITTMKPISSKAFKIAPSPTLAISARAKEMKNQGINVIGFGAGQPDFNTPNHIREAAKKAIDEGFTGYTPAAGIVELKEAVCEKFKKENNLDFKPSQVIISNGAKHSLYNTFQALLDPGDEVIIPVPYWVSYPQLVEMAGGTPVFVETEEEHKFKITPQQLKKVINEKTKALIINSPNNPTGTVYTKKDLEDIAEIAVSNDLYIISDEIYEKLLYDEDTHFSIAQIDEEVKRRTIIINGVSKAYAMTGWRIGYAAGEEKIIKVMSNIQSHATSNPNSIAQKAAVAALLGAQKPVEDMVNEFSKRRDYMVNKINDIEGLSCINPKGAFYVFVNISKIKGKTVSDKKLSTSDDIANVLLDDFKVAVIPGSAFGMDNYIRLSYAVSMDDIQLGLDRIQRFVSSII